MQLHSPKYPRTPCLHGCTGLRSQFQVSWDILLGQGKVPVFILHGIFTVNAILVNHRHGSDGCCIRVIRQVLINSKMCEGKDEV
jgi:hypothetical protein